MSLSKDRNTRAKWQGMLAEYKVAASKKIYGGALVCVDSNGYLNPGGTTAGFVCVGRADGLAGSTELSTADNSSGSDGDISCKVQQGVFKWANSSGSAVVQGDVGHVVYVEDDQTVAHSASNSIIAGICVAVETDGVWVLTLQGMQGLAQIGYPNGGALETVTSGALSVTKRTSLLSIDGTKAYSLADGTVVGQRKSLRCSVAANTPAGTVTPAHMVGGSTLAFNAVDDSVELEWQATGWTVVAINSVTVA